MQGKGSRQSLPVGLDKISQAYCVLSSRDDREQGRGVIFAVKPLFCIGICMKDINTFCVCKSGIATCWAFAKETSSLLSLLIQELKSLIFQMVIKSSMSIAVGDFCDILLSLVKVEACRGP